MKWITDGHLFLTKQGKGRKVSMDVTNYRHKLKTKIKLGMEIRNVEESMV